jgi:TatD DNase family protein
MMKLFDTHTHLDLIQHKNPGRDLEHIWQEGQKAGVVHACQIGIDLKSSIKALEISAQCQGVYAAIGFHPSNKMDEAQIQQVIELARSQAKEKNPHFIGIGETGLDYHWIKEESERGKQKLALVKFLHLARELDKTLIIHARPGTDYDALADLEQILPGEKILPRIILHCFAGSAAYVDKFARLGTYFSFAGNVTYKNAKSLQEAVKRVPAEKILLETDAPYLSPVPQRGKINEPAFIKHTFEFVAASLGKDQEYFADQIYRNSLQAFGLDNRF